MSSRVCTPCVPWEWNQVRSCFSNFLKESLAKKKISFRKKSTSSLALFTVHWIQMWSHSFSFIREDPTGHFTDEKRPDILPAQWHFEYWITFATKVIQYSKYKSNNQWVDLWCAWNVRWLSWVSSNPQWFLWHFDLVRDQLLITDNVLHL